MAGRGYLEQDQENTNSVTKADLVNLQQQFTELCTKRVIWIAGTYCSNHHGTKRPTTSCEQKC